MLRFLFVVTLAIFIGVIIQYDPGYVLIHYHHWVIETPVWFAVVLMIAATILFHLFFKIFHAPKEIYHWYQNKVEQRYHEDMNQLLKNSTFTNANKSAIATLKRYQILNETALKQLEKQFYLDQKNLISTYKNLPKKFRLDPDIIEIYLKQLIAQREFKTAGKFLEKYLKKNGINYLVHYYGLAIYDAKSQLKIAERWLTKNPKNAALLFALGKISHQLKLWGKARQYYEQSVAIKPDFNTYHALIELLEYLQQPQLTYEFYQKALAVAPN
jgi:uncharacterized protein HemY